LAKVLVTERVMTAVLLKGIHGNALGYSLRSLVVIAYETRLIVACERYGLTAITLDQQVVAVALG